MAQDSAAPHRPTVLYGLAALVAAANLYLNTVGVLVPEFTRNLIHFAGFAALALLMLPAVSGAARERLRATPKADLALAALAVAASGYILSQEVPLAARGFDYTAADYAAGALFIVLACEAARRAAGLVVPILVLAALSYIAVWGRFVPGSLGFPGLSWEVVLLRTTYNEDGMLGQIASISSSFVFMFVLFGAFLVRSGASEAIIDLGRALARRLTGGPGMVAVITSALTGTISGSAVANTVSTGSVTIPLMKRSGFPPRFAGGVEAAASTGGQLMPPVMGAGAFAMASFTQIPYLDIIAVAALPALLYFLGVAFAVRIQALKHGIVPEGDAAPGLGQALRSGGLVFLIPIAVLIVCLVVRFTPTLSAGIAILSVVAASWLTPTPMGPRAMLDALVLGARTMAPLAVLLVAVGAVVGVINTTGLGPTISLQIASWSGGSLIIALVLVAVASLILGMGLPVTAAYIVLATLSAPGLRDMILEAELIRTLTETGLPPMLMALASLSPDLALPADGMVTAAQAADALAFARATAPDLAATLQADLVPATVALAALLSAHMIVFWLSQDSNVTPPVCLAAFAAAGIAGSRPMATGVTAWRIAKALYIVPVLFAFTPLLSGDWALAVPIALKAAVGLYALITALEGYAESPLGPIGRVLMAAAGTLLLWPAAGLASLVLALAGAGLAGAVVWSARRALVRAPRSP